MHKDSLLKVVNKFHDTQVLVIGDIMLDKFVWGKVKRISPEAPVPVVEITKETYMPGGAGNVVSNIISLGGIAHLVGIIGDDASGNKFVNDMNLKGVKTSGIMTLHDRPTIIKTRIIAEHQQIVRVDKEVRKPISAGSIKKLIDSIKEKVKKVSVVIISDYGKGVISKKILNAAIKYAHQYKKPILVDPKIEHFNHYKKVTCITPNLFEALQGTHTLRVETQTDVEKLGFKIMKKLEVDSLLITQGERGMTLFEKQGEKTHIPTVAQEVYDVTGAGDTVISTLAMCLANGSSILESAYISNYAAGIVVGKLGTAIITQKEIENSIQNKL